MRWSLWCLWLAGQSFGMAGFTIVCFSVLGSGVNARGVICSGLDTCVVKESGVTCFTAGGSEGNAQDTRMPFWNPLQ